MDSDTLFVVAGDYKQYCYYCVHYRLRNWFKYVIYLREAHQLRGYRNFYITYLGTHYDKPFEKNEKLCHLTQALNGTVLDEGTLQKRARRMTIAERRQRNV